MDQRIADQAAAQRSGKSQHKHAEYVQLVAYRLERAGHGEGYRTNGDKALQEDLFEHDMVTVFF